MDRVGWLLEAVADVVRTNRFWMTWNLALATIPAILAVVLLPGRGPRRALWWAGVVVMVLFLPNAPYVVTDLVHLRWNIDRVASGRVVVLAVLPVFTAFIAAGFAAYLVAMDRIVAEVRAHVPRASRFLIELGVHAICTVGIVLGRVARLNSWDTVTSPRHTFERTFTTLSWSGAPVAALAVFVAVLVTYTLVRQIVLLFTGTAERLAAVIARA